MRYLTHLIFAIGSPWDQVGWPWDRGGHDLGGRGIADFVMFIEMFVKASYATHMHPGFFEGREIALLSLLPCAGIRPRPGIHNIIYIKIPGNRSSLSCLLNAFCLDCEVRNVFKVV